MVRSDVYQRNIESDKRMRLTVNGALLTIKKSMKWWFQQLEQSLPVTIKTFFTENKAVLRLLVSDEKLVIKEMFGRTEKVKKQRDYLWQDLDSKAELVEQLSITLKNKQLELFVPYQQVIIKRIQLPKVALENLENVLKFEMDLYTPLTSEQVLYGYKVLESDDQWIAINLMVTPKRGIEKILKQLSNYGLSVHRIYSNEFKDSRDDNSFPDINLLPAVPEAESVSPLSNLTGYLFIALLILIGATIYLPINQKIEQLNYLNVELKQAKKEAVEIIKLKNDIDESVKKLTTIVRAKTKEAVMLEVINELSLVLPEDSWVYQFNKKQNFVQIRGYAAKASSVMTSIESSSLFSHTQFKSPVVTDKRVKKERFDLKMKIEKR